MQCTRTPIPETLARSVSFCPLTHTIVLFPLLHLFLLPPALQSVQISFAEESRTTHDS